MDNVSRGILRKNKREILGTKNTVTGMKNAFDRLISRLDMAEERISKLEDVNRNFQNGKAKRKKTWKKTPE